MHFETTRAEHSLVDEIFSVGHANHYNVIQCLHTVDVGQQLVDHKIGCICAVIDGASLFADSIDFVEYNDVQWTFVPVFCLVLSSAYE